MSRGDIVPEVRITDLKDANTCTIAKEQSKQVNDRTGSFNEPSLGLG